MHDDKRAARIAREREATEIAAWLRGLPCSPGFRGTGWQLAYALFGGYWHALCDLIEARAHR